jgi:hypothetical protein
MANDELINIKAELYFKLGSIKAKHLYINFPFDFLPNWRSKGGISNANLASCG